MRGRYRRIEAHSVRQQAGVGDQALCPNGTYDCPGPDSDKPDLPCSACFFEASSEDDADDGEVA